MDDIRSLSSSEPEVDRLCRFLS
ncbi:hypothetical protein NC651_003636 [Populus alba x Populus x berolinensis]|nr:hypothetical protein NC651_003636 [Populus alba x Populus x berolinensis]